VKSGYKTIVYFIAATILVTISIQVYWNVIHYQANKKEFINQVHTSLNNSVESYYATMAQSHVFKFISSDSDSLDFNESTISHIDRRELVDTIVSDSTVINGSFKKQINVLYLDSTEFTNLPDAEFLIEKHRIDELTSKIVISITNDSIELVKLKQILKEDFEAKDWPIKFGLIARDLTCKDNIKPIACDSIRRYGLEEVSKDYLSSISKSAFLPPNNTLEIRYSNITKVLLKKSLGGMLLSLILSLAIVSSLLYLLSVIKKQKQLAEIKNDLISNITHEFKTPITTISSALQAIENFNTEDDKEKTKKYLEMSNQQVEKLNLMVEKLLETATLDSDQLNIQNEETDLPHLLKQIVVKHSLIANNKRIDLKMNESIKSVMVDPFHFENAIVNIIDNAVKYGGDLISVELNKIENGFEIRISDDGEGINKQQQLLIFEKFYRIPKGNIHDIKGFGIGLYYSKKIIEKHGGKLSLSSHPGKTIFKITMDA